MIQIQMLKCSFDSTEKNIIYSIQERDGQFNTLSSMSKCEFSFLIIYLICLHNFRRDRNRVRRLLRNFPNLDRDLVQREYPDVDVKDIDYKDRARGHFIPKID